MTDPTPHARRSPMEHERDTPEPAPDLVERVALEIAGNRAVDNWMPSHDDRELARAVVALVIDEAAKVAEEEANYVPLRRGDMTRAIRALLPEAKP